jgi:hypothetical protein
MSEREIFCDECGDCAVEVDQGALGEDLDGIHATCQSCNIDGKIIWQDDADEAGAYTILKFRKLTESEESELAALACDDRDEVELEVDRMFQAKDLEELAKALIREGWFDEERRPGPGLAKCGPKKSDLPN